MSLFRGAQERAWTTISGLPRADRTGQHVTATPSATTANRQSVVWAAIHRKASLLSSMPVDVFRRIDGVAVEAPKPGVLVEPWAYADGQPETIAQWLYSSQRALEGYGNSVGVIHSRDGMGLPSQIELIEPESVRFRVSRRRIVEYRIHGEVVPARNIWHERMYGGPVGLSPIAFAALTLYGAEAAQRFAADWFGGDAIPGAVLRNAEKTVSDTASDAIKARFRNAVSTGDLFVVGKDWEYDPIQAKAVETGFIEMMNVSDAALCRFFGVPASEVDVPVESSTVNYANVQQANLQLLVKHLGPSVDAREDALSRLTARPRFVKLNRSSLLAMDDKTRAEVNELRIRARYIAPSEVREKEDLQPLTPEQVAEFDALFGNPNKPTPQGAKA